MAIDSATKRFSMMGRGMPWSRPLPVPSGGFDRAGRLQLLAVYTVPISILWRGNVNTNWSLSNNWNPSIVPNQYTKCNFPGGTFRPCTLTADATCYSLALGSLWGRYLTLGSFDMTVHNDVDILGGGIDRADGTFVVGGDFTQLGGILNFSTAGPATMAIAGDFDVSGSAIWFVTDLDGHTITVGGDLSFDTTGTLDLLAGGEWFLQVDGAAVVTNVNVAYSNATGFTQIDATDESNTDSDNNLNWLFESLIDQTITFPTVIRRPSSVPGIPLRKTSGAATHMRRVSDTNTTLRRPH